MTTPTQALQEQRDQIALEFMSLAEPAKRLTDFIPHAKAMLVKLYGYAEQVVEPIAPLTAKQAEFLTTVASRNYVNLTQMPTRVPEGLQVPYLHYLHVLAEASNNASQVVERLSQYTIFLGSLINEHQAQLGTQFGRAYYTGLKNERDHLNEMLGTCFKPGSTKVDGTYATVVQRNADWKEVFHTLNLVSAQINNVNRRTINKKIEEAGHFLEILEKKIARGELDSITPQMTAELAEGAYEMGREVEQFVNVWYKAQALTQSVNKTIAALVNTYAPK
jgi:hypothetical protein